MSKEEYISKIKEVCEFGIKDPLKHHATLKIVLALIEELESTQQPTVTTDLSKEFKEEFIKEFLHDSEFSALFESMKRGMTPYEAIEYLCKRKKELLKTTEELIKNGPTPIMVEASPDLVKKPTVTSITDEGFIDAVNEVREDFTQYIMGNFPPSMYNTLRTKIDTLIIMYDQMRDKLTTPKQSEQNDIEGLKKLYLPIVTSTQLTTDQKIDAIISIGLMNINTSWIGKQSDNSELLDALKWFCRRVDMGEVRSRKTYAKFRGLIEKYDK